MPIRVSLTGNSTVHCYLGLVTQCLVSSVRVCRVVCVVLCCGVVMVGGEATQPKKYPFLDVSRLDRDAAVAAGPRAGRGAAGAPVAGAARVAASEIFI